MAIDVRSALRVVGAAGILGVLGEILFHDAAWGLNIAVWIAALGLGAILLSKRLDRRIPKPVVALAPAILLFAGCFAIHEAPELKLANGLALFLLMGAALASTSRGNLTKSSIYELSVDVVRAWFRLTSNFAKLIADERLLPKSDEAKARIRAVVNGVLIATPLLVVFGGLFVSADDDFRRLVTGVFDFHWVNPYWLLQTVAIFVFCAVMAGGTYRVLLLEQAAELPETQLSDPLHHPQLGMTEISVVLGLLNAMFGLFVVVQAQYFFGGVHQVLTVQGLTDSKYARHGFFELTAVAAGAMATILVFQSLMKDPERNQRSFRILAGTMVALVGVVLISAFQRMDLYVRFAGLTEMRVYATSFMVWIASTLVWLAATALRGRRRRFAWGSMVCGLACILGLNVLNPDVAIARFDTQPTNRPADLALLESLSVDAAPAFVNGLPGLPPGQATQLRTELKKRWSQAVDTDWRGINYSRWRYLNDYRHEL